MEKLVPICRNNDFRRIYARGKSYVSPLVVVYALKNRTKNVRVGITTSKKVGNAVQRNRSRRVIREAFRALAPGVRPGFDLVLVARGKTPYVKSTDVRRQLERQLQAAGLLREETP
ncbi:MAG TPA: ribonuclease P protein component [Candidatus Acutalibacter ornithocaccae]|uniref:Ribonuclease P protein component n=1 Tax=Candidatus Acutalibacter ornithocaccae TaxID=2838416 RepID=A0A9D2LVY2_9FIRM|nr:ribonuclease P protein component [Candidatus Acutalibacter ornithocaccae]